MTVLEFLLLLVIAGIAGSIAQAIAGYSHMGCLASVAVGFIGALLGTWMARTMGIPEIFAIQLGNVSFPIIWSIIGATIFVALVGLLRRAR
jgi:uncharacterized membrane protein YeaQ/YmgE (transglycosylase-associated protein family)